MISARRCRRHTSAGRRGPSGACFTGNDFGGADRLYGGGCPQRSRSGDGGQPEGHDSTARRTAGDRGDARARGGSPMGVASAAPGARPSWGLAVRSGSNHEQPAGVGIHRSVTPACAGSRSAAEGVPAWRTEGPGWPSGGECHGRRVSRETTPRRTSRVGGRSAADVPAVTGDRRDGMKIRRRPRDGGVDALGRPRGTTRRWPRRGRRFECPEDGSVPGGRPQPVGSLRRPWGGGASQQGLAPPE